MSTPAAPGRRTASTARRRFDVISALTVLLPVLTLLAAYGVHADAEQPAPMPPRATALDRATVLCPSGGGSSQVQVASLSGATGDLSAQLGGAQQSVPVTPHAPVTVTGSGAPLVVSGRDDLAPGLLAGRFRSPLAAADCRPPVADQWFTGVGAGAKHDSVLELTNPDAGRALVDVVVLGRDGVVDAPSLRGIPVGGGQTVKIDLGTTVPRRHELALHVTTIRGRVAASVADSFDELGGGDSGADWLPAQSGPGTDNLLLGLPSGTGRRTLVLANPGDSEGRATIRLVTPQSVFTPEGVHDVVVPPQGVVRVSLTKLLSSGATKPTERPIGIELVSTVPLTASLLLFVDGDLARGVPLPPLTGTGAALLPDGKKQLVLAGATRPGVVTVSSWGARGQALPDVRVAVTGGQGYAVDLPTNARLMTLTPQKTPVSATVLVTGKGSTEVQVREPLTSGLVPQVRPGTP